jgi:hypothetical protein
LITNAILVLVTGIATSLASVITALGSVISTVDTYLADLQSYVFGYLVFIQPICDPALLFWCVTVLVTLILAAMLFRVANWLFNKIPLIAGFGWE